MIESNNSDLIEWIEKLEELFQEKIYEKRHTWFETKIDMDDIQNTMTDQKKHQDHMIKLETALLYLVVVVY